MESVFRDVSPPSKRRNTQFVFRQGSPLDPAALRMVAAAKARTVIIAGDHSRFGGSQVACSGRYAAYGIAGQQSVCLGQEELNPPPNCNAFLQQALCWDII